MENQEKKDEEEIDLRDYINVILKRKWGIIAIFLIAVIVSTIISLKLPQTFEAIALIKIAQVKEKNLESANEIKEIFSRPFIFKEIAQKLNFPPEISLDKVAQKISLEIVEKTGFLRIKGRAETPEKAVEITNAATEILLNRHEKLFEEAKKTLDLETGGIIKEKEKTAKDIEQTKKDIERFEKDINKYEKEISRRADAQSEAQGRIAESYINLLANSKNQKEAKEREILNLEQQLINLDQTIQQKEYEKTYQTKPTSVEVPATPPDTRIAPKRTQNVAIAGILGLFIGILWAFAAEFFSKTQINADKRG